MKYLIPLLLLITSCTAPKHILADSDSISTEIRETTTFKDSSYTENYTPPAESVKNTTSASDTSHVETSLAESDAWIDENGNIRHTIRNKSEAIIPIIVNLKIPHLQTNRRDYINMKRNIIVEVERQFTIWEIFHMTIGKIAMAIFLLWITIKIIKSRI